MSFPKPCGEIEKEKMVQPVTEVVTVQLLPQIICSVYTHIVLLTVQLYCFNCCAVHNSFINTHTYTVYSYKEYAFYFYFLQNLFMFFLHYSLYYPVLGSDYMDSAQLLQNFVMLKMSSVGPNMNVRNEEQVL